MTSKLQRHPEAVRVLTPLTEFIFQKMVLRLVGGFPPQTEETGQGSVRSGLGTAGPERPTDRWTRGHSKRCRLPEPCLRQSVTGTDGEVTWPSAELSLVIERPDQRAGGRPRTRLSGDKDGVTEDAS